MTETLRLHKFLADCGIASRRAAEKLIAEGRVTVNGRVAHVGQKITPNVDVVVCNGMRVEAENSHVYLMFYKPRGVTTTLSDPFAKKTLQDFLPPNVSRVFPVGRLDKDSEGLLILTNDGDLAQRLTHPGFEHEKEYLVTVDKRLTAKDIDALRNGVSDKGETLTCASIEQIDGRTLRIVLTQGKNRHIRRMLESLGFTAETLVRIRIGKLNVGNLRPGEIRKISGKRLKDL